ncbi:MAG: succinate dehydrogenase cytochrome b subunit [bacterium]|nr:succinate dehydrogenase cytochrome b subunit [bacterium]
MTWILEIYRSAMAKKAVMAVTGVVLFGFVLGHMVGNLKVFLGPVESDIYKIDLYAEGLRTFGAPFLGHGEFLWITRFGLLAAVGLHILSAWQLTVLNNKARPTSYRKQTSQASTYASRTMRYGGVIILLFVIYHLLHLTTGHVHTDFEHGKVYRNLVIAFQNPLVAAFYMLAVTSLGFHLYHGLWSFFQSLGLSGPRLDVFRRQFAAVFAVIVTAGFLSVPVAILTGLVN